MFKVILGNALIHVEEIPLRVVALLHISTVPVVWLPELRQITTNFF